jgi:hypothetical protein
MVYKGIEKDCSFFSFYVSHFSLANTYDGTQAKISGLSAEKLSVHSQLYNIR